LDRIDVALIGAGRMGQVHGGNAARHPRLRLTHVVDPRPAARETAEGWGARMASLDEVLADPNIGGVLICSTTDQHLAHALAAQASGKAIFCEKPVDLDLARARTCAEAVKRAGVACLIGFQRRYDPTFAGVKARLDAGEIGTPEMRKRRISAAASRSGRSGPRVIGLRIIPLSERFTRSTSAAWRSIDMFL